MTDQRPLVLVAEDDPSVRLTIEFVLEDEGFEVLMAEDGAAALDYALRKRPDVILLDQMMPKMNGREVLTALQEDESTRAIPVLVLSGMGRHESKEWEGVEFVGKPFSPEDLINRLHAALAPEERITHS